MKQLKCPYCNNKLVNASFHDGKIFVYLTCIDCWKRTILLKEDYDDYFKDYSEYSKLNRWV